jgi:hypothetical protein
VGVGKPSKDFTCPLGMPRDTKDLLHMLNAIVSPMTVNLCFLLSFCFLFCFTKGLANISLWVFDVCQILLIWTP